jgi:methionyl-tRNA formyltransferase
MKIILIAMDEPLHLPRVYEKVISTRKDDFKRIYLVSPIPPKQGVVKFLATHFILLGPVGFLKISIKNLHHKLCDVLKKWIKTEGPYSIRSLAEKYEIPVARVKDVNDQRFVEDLKKMGPDVVISASPQIFKKDLLSVPAVGCINVHSALLPKYKGVYPMFWALLNGENEVGVTIHLMEEKLDNGKILLQRRFNVEGSDTMMSLYEKACEISPYMILEALNILERGGTGTEMEGGGSYFSYPTMEDVKKLRTLGKKVI